MPIQDCRPSYVKDGSYIPSAPATEPAVAPSYSEIRGRLTTGGTFFRTKDATSELIEVEYIENPIEPTEVLLNVYYLGALTETFGPIIIDTPVDPDPCVPTTNAAMRALVNGVSNLIEMPSIDYGGVAFGATPTWDAAIDETCVSLFTKTNLTGGQGLPTASVVTTIFTGPDRTIIILQLTEIVANDVTDTGVLDEPPLNRKVLQYDGTDWISYIPNSDCCTVGVDC